MGGRSRWAGPTEDNIIILPLKKFAGVRVGWKSWSVNSLFLGNLYMGGVTDIHIHARRHQDRGRQVPIHITNMHRNVWRAYLHFYPHMWCWLVITGWSLRPRMMMIFSFLGLMYYLF